LFLLLIVHHLFKEVSEEDSGCCGFVSSRHPFSWKYPGPMLQNVEHIYKLAFSLQHELKDLVEKAGGKLATRLKEGEFVVRN
jgi:hypothetical protein